MVKLILLTGLCFIGLGLAEIVKDGQYFLRNQGDKTYLTLKNEVTQLCQPLGKVTTELKSNPENQKWTTSWFGEKPGDFDGVHLVMRNTKNEITYNTAYPPFCFPIYSGWRVNQTDFGGYLIQNIQDENCLESHGNGRLIERHLCNVGRSEQHWEFLPAK